LSNPNKLAAGPGLRSYLRLKSKCEYLLIASFSMKIYILGLDMVNMYNLVKFKV